MARSKAKPKAPVQCKDSDPGIRAATEAILGLFVMAFGHGVPTGIHVRKQVISAIRDMLREHICSTITKFWNNGEWEKKWQRESNTVLNLMQSVGNLAARYAFQNGERTILTEDDFDTAFKRVHEEHGGGKFSILGDWCPPYF